MEGSPTLAVFRDHGSDDYAKVVKGHELSRIMKYFPSKFVLSMMFLFSFLSGLVPCLYTIFLGEFTTIGSRGGHFIDDISKSCINLVFVLIAHLLVSFVSYALKFYNVPLFKFRLRKALFDNLIKQSMTFYDKNSTGLLISRISEDVIVIQRTFLELLFDVVLNLTFSLAGLVISIVTCWKAGLVAMCAIPVIFIVFFLAELYVDKVWRKFNDTTTLTATKAEEVISQFRTVKSFDCEMEEYEKYKRGLNSIHSLFKKASIAHGVKHSISTLTLYGMLTGVCYYAAYLIVHDDNSLEVGDFMVLVSNLVYLTMGFTQISTFIDEYKKGIISASKVLDLIDYKPDTDIYEGNSLSNVEGKIEFHNVGFRYQGNNEWAVKNLSLSINAGETVALVGESGCGKTTTLSLLQRFYEIEEGQITIDGVDIKTLSQEYLRSQIAVVPQTPVLFSMSVADNIRYACTDKTEDDIKAAAQISNADDFIMELNEKYDTMVQQNSLSGGQKQRLCIARAVLVNAPILLLDEATAALDTESEHLVQNSIEKFRKGKTVIIVAHRLSTVLNADRIYVFKGGSIIETGKHEELLAKGGEYTELIKFQLQ